MTLRKRRSDGGEFWGCSRFPACRSVRQIEAVALEPEAMRPSAPPLPQPTIAAPADDPIETGLAGGSAREKHDRLAARRQAEVKGRWGNRLGGIVLALNEEPQHIRAWGTGSVGEVKLAEALAKVEGIVALHDRRVPGTRGNVDHLVVAPSGVWVVDTKRYEGEVRLRDVGGLLHRDVRLYVGRRDQSKLADAMAWQVREVEAALSRAGIEDAGKVRSVLCFVDATWPLFGAPDEFRGVRIEDPKSLGKVLARERGLEPGAVERIARALAKELPPKAVPARRVLGDGARS